MSQRTVFCVKLQQDGEGLDRPPFPNDLGKRLFESVSKQAWKDWIAHSTMLVNENRLTLGTPQATQFLLKQCEAYFFGDGGAMPEGYVPPKT